MDHEISEDELTVMNKKCNALDAAEGTAYNTNVKGIDWDPVSMNVKCDTKAITTNLFKKADCKGEGDDTHAWTQKWGACTKMTMAGVPTADGTPNPEETTFYVKFTGAKALAAASAAAAALFA